MKKSEITEITALYFLDRFALRIPIKKKDKLYSIIRKINKNPIWILILSLLGILSYAGLSIKLP